MNVADLIKSRRTKKELSYRELSEMTGVSHTYIRDIENGKYAPSFENAEKLAKALDIDMEQIIFLTYQAQFRQTLLDLITACHKYQVKIHYDEWLKTSLPLQPLNRDDTTIHDFAVKTLNDLHLINDPVELQERISLMNWLSSTAYNRQLYELFSEFLAFINMYFEHFGLQATIEKAEPFLNGLKKEILEETRRKKDDK
jgi:transcriptional regulator with XRE-family HTH domain